VDRLFLDANVLFSAAYKDEAPLCGLWKLRDVVLLSSPYAIDEARSNLETDQQRRRLDSLIQSVVIATTTVEVHLPASIALPAKDEPILRAAIYAHSTHLLTGDRAHFGKYFGRTIKGVNIQSPSEYLSIREMTEGI
jgi:uncharacterized protein